MTRKDKDKYKLSEKDWHETEYQHDYDEGKGLLTSVTGILAVIIFALLWAIIFIGAAWVAGRGI